MAKSALLIAIVGISAALKCTKWREIAPCTCTQNEYITINCNGHPSYAEIADTLKGHFTPDHRVHLDINSSSLHDINLGTFKDFNMTIEKLKMNHVIFGHPLNESTFDGLYFVKYLSLADTNLNDVPENLWEKMPNVSTLDLGRSNLHHLTSTNFKNLPALEHLIVPGNLISWMDENTFPKQLTNLHIGRNLIKDLNNTLNHLTNLQWLFVNANKLTNLDGQLPFGASKLFMIHASHNYLERLPQQLKTFPNLHSLFFQNNKLIGLDGTISKSRRLVRLYVDYNLINTLSKEDFKETEKLQTLTLSHNQLTTLNNSFVNLTSLNFLDVSHNQLEEFSLQDIVGLEMLKEVHLSNNKINKLSGPPSNAVEWNIKLEKLKLDHNKLETLNGALSNLLCLNLLNISYNHLKIITPDDLIGMDELVTLDISYNNLITLEEMSKTFLPKLSTLIANHNQLTILDRDFHGLPVLCNAEFQHNEIYALGRDLVAKTRCQKPSANEGTWDMLKIDLQDNPILCDAALPEITSLMEVNHTKITGVTKNCLPLIEQPVTSKINQFLGYIPDNITTSTTTISTPMPIASGQISIVEEPLNILPIMNNPLPDASNTNNFPYPIDGGFHNNEQYTVETDPQQQTPNNDLAPLALQSIDNALTLQGGNQSEIGSIATTNDENREKHENLSLVDTLDELEYLRSNKTTLIAPTSTTEQSTTEP